MTSDQLIKLLDLKPHPEGGYYRETYRSTLVLPGGTFESVGPRSAGTAIYFLLVSGSVSHFHRLVYDEIFHFYMGDPVNWTLLHPDGRVERRTLGSLPGRDQQFQTVMPAGSWFGGALKEGGNFALMGTTMAPGFEFEDFELADRAELLNQYPSAEPDILSLT